MPGSFPAHLFVLLPSLFTADQVFLLYIAAVTLSYLSPADIPSVESLCLTKPRIICVSREWKRQRHEDTVTYAGRNKKKRNKEKKPYVLWMKKEVDREGDGGSSSDKHVSDI